MKKKTGAALTLSVLTASLIGASVADAATAARLALVIGNDAYVHVRPLANAGNDARLIANTLKAAGFEVVGGVRTNLDRESMWTAIDQLQGRIQKGDEVVFYFAGHGVQIGASPMLLPIDINADRDEKVLRNGVNLADVQDALKNARLGLLVIDACRDNPFPRQPGHTRGIGETRGLIPIEAAEGTAIFMSASRGQSALDMVPGVTASDGLFTYALVQAIRTPGLDVRTAMYRARDDVEERARRANHDQRPSLTDEMRGTFVFFPATASLTSVRPPSPSADAKVASVGRLRITSTPSAAKIYIDGAYSGLAPLELSDVPTGVHAVRAELDGYIPFDQKVRVSSQQQLLVQSTLSITNREIPHHETAAFSITNKEIPHRETAARTIATIGKNFPPPEEYYPAASKRLGEEGAPVVRACVEPDGKLWGLPTIAESSGSDRIDEAAIKLAHDVNYVPATEGGRPVRGCFQFRIRFKLAAPKEPEQPPSG